MKVLKLTLITISLSLIVQSCVINCLEGSGNVITEERSLSGYHSVDLRGTGNIYITQGEEYYIKLKTDDNIMPLISTTVKKCILLIASEKCIGKITCLDVHITMKEIKGLTVSGSGDILGDSLIVAKNLDININGSSKINLNLEATTITSTISGSGDIKLRGHTKVHNAKINGSGTISCFDLGTKRTEVKINGSGNCNIYASEVLNIEINGSGDVIYQGDPKVTSNTKGSGSVRSKNWNFRFRGAYILFGGLC